MSRACPLCNKSIFADWRFSLLHCKACDLVVADSVWRPGANEQFNEVSFGEQYTPVRSFWVRMFEEWNNRRTINRLSNIGGINGGRLLEIGVGSGSFLAYAKSRGYSPVGCDLSASICCRVESVTGISVHWGPVESLSEQQLFDVAVMNHVLEHVSDPVDLLKAVRARLKPGGWLYLAVPNVAAWEARLRGWNSYASYHLLYFTPQTLRLCVEKATFAIHALGTHESFSGWFLAILRTLLRRGHFEHVPEEFNPPSKACNWRFVEHPYRLLMLLWGAITVPARRLQEFLGKGDEIILVARNELLE